MAAQRIIACYPDYGKAPPEYLGSLMRALETYSVDVMARLADLRTGVPSKVKYLPTIADVIELGNKLAEDEHKTARYSAIQHRRPIAIEGPRAAFRPFPKLWEAFADDPAVLAKLDKGLPFGTLSHADKLRATDGTWVAKAFLERTA